LIVVADFHLASVVAIVVIVESGWDFEFFVVVVVVVIAIVIAVIAVVVVVVACSLAGRWCHR